MKQKDESKEEQKATKKEARHILSSFVFLKGMIKQEAHQTTRSICDDIGYIGGSDSENKLKDFDKETDKEDYSPFSEEAPFWKASHKKAKRNENKDVKKDF